MVPSDESSDYKGECTKVKEKYSFGPIHKLCYKEYGNVKVYVYVNDAKECSTHVKNSHDSYTDYDINCFEMVKGKFEDTCTLP